MCEEPIIDTVDLGNVESFDNMSDMSSPNESIGSGGVQIDSGTEPISDTALPTDSATHGISFGARLDVDKYNGLARQKSEANTILKETSSDAEFLEAFTRREEAQKEMNDMLANSDEFKSWSDAIDRKIDACLDPLRRNGIL